MKKSDLPHKGILDSYIDKLKSVKEVIAVYCTGSTATKKWDEYSDLDIDIVVEDKDYDKICKKLPKLLDLGDMKFYNNYPGIDETYVYMGDKYLKVDMEPIKKGGLGPKWSLKDIRIIFDKEGTLTRVHKQSQGKKLPNLTHKEAVNFFIECRDIQFYTARHCARGLRFSAMNEVNSAWVDLFRFMARIKGMTDFHLVRGAEKVLSVGERKLFKMPKLYSDSPKEIEKGMMQNWKIMIYLEKLYEKKFKKLNLPCNDKEILRVVKGLYG